MENYKPSTEEIKKGEDNMTSIQKNISDLREKVSRMMKERFGVEGYLEFVDSRLTGEINGHKISIIKDGDEWVEGKIDDIIKMTHEEIQSFIKKYGRIYANYSPGSVKKAHFQEKEFVLKEIGL
ncbi:hypothetical protein HYW73_00655 [Candidatus Nomurabacteria bacterium]|nr:hypothetical protein [Candidatus Nomurabacteria bacterium]